MMMKTLTFGRKKEQTHNRQVTQVQQPVLRGTRNKCSGCSVRGVARILHGGTTEAER